MTATAKLILACDLGGTKTDLAILEPAGTGLRIVRRETYRSRDYASIDEVLATFLGASPPRLLAAGFGVAGPVFANRAKTTNLPWTVDGERLALTLGLRRVSLLNDVEAQAWSLLQLDARDWIGMQSGRADAGNMALIAAGTGLGFGALVRGEGPVRSLASEGGHADFSATEDIEIELVRWLRRDCGHVSVEKVLSGPGLYRVYKFLRKLNPSAEPDWLAVALEHGDPAAVVAEAALNGHCALAERAVLLFLGAYGAEAANWALRTMSTGGIWLGGGVSRKLLVGPKGTPETWRARARATFLARFRNKGRFSPLVEEMSVRTILSDNAPLLGSGQFAWSESRR